MNTPESKSAHQARAGERIKELRLALGLTQERLAIATGYDRKLVSEVERGEQWPPHTWLITLAEVYEVPESYILRGAHRATLPPEIEKALTDFRRKQRKEAEAARKGALYRHGVDPDGKEPENRAFRVIMCFLAQFTVLAHAVETVVAGRGWFAGSVLGFWA